MKTKNILLMILLIIFIRLVFMVFEGYAFSEDASIQKSNTNGADQIELLLRKDTNYGSAVLYKNIDTNLLGIAKIEKRFNLLWRVKSNTRLKRLVEDVPFVVTGEHIRNSDEEDQLIIGFHAEDYEMAYVVCGPENDKIVDHFKTATMDDFLKNYPEYHLEKIQDGYALILQKEYQVENWNFYVFDQDKNLLATKIAGTGDAIYVK